MKKGPVVRVSIGRFDPGKLDTVEYALNAAQDKLVSGIRAMHGNRSYFAGIDRENFAMVNVSVWDSVEAAKQMESFQPMLDLAKEFASVGVRFERPVLNFEQLWTIEK